jgi:hypothetical protein
MGLLLSWDTFNDVHIKYNDHFKYAKIPHDCRHSYDQQSGFVSFRSPLERPLIVFCFLGVGKSLTTIVVTTSEDTIDHRVDSDSEVVESWRTRFEYIGRRQQTNWIRALLGRNRGTDESVIRASPFIFYLPEAREGLFHHNSWNNVLKNLEIEQN